MKVFYSPAHHIHDPQSEFTSSGPIPYPECARRASEIANTLAADPAFVLTIPEPLDPTVLNTIHDEGFLHFLAQIYAGIAPHSAELTPTTFPLRGRGQRPPTLRAQAGYYGFDTTPLTPGSWGAALAAASAASAGATCLLNGATAAYALCRPPGHHAGRDYFGGYCYLNNAALAAATLAAHGRVAILDIDYHQGNGTQDIFYDSDRALFVSIHADPAYQYPLYWGYVDETGTGAGQGLTCNFPLPAATDDSGYLSTLDQALTTIAAYDPAFLVLSAGLDLYTQDPLGDWLVSLDGIGGIGERIRHIRKPTLIVQEGGYCLEKLGAAARALLDAFIC